MFSTTSNSLFITFDKPYYTNSDTVTGTISLNISTSFRAKSLEFTIKAREGVKFCQYETQRIKTSFDEYRQVLVPREQQTKLFTHKGIMPVWKGEMIPVGQYTFPFTFVVPSKTPGSFDYYSKDASVFVVYTTKGKIVDVDNSENLIKSMNVLIVRQHAKELEYSKIRQNSKTLTTCGCCSKGRMALDVTFTQDNFSLEDPVTMNLVLKNTDCGLPMQGIQMILYQELILRGDNSTKIFPREVGRFNIKGGIEAGKMKATPVTIPIKDDENPSLKCMNNHRFGKLFTDEKIIAKFQACTKGKNVVCRYHISTDVTYSGSCLEKPVFRIPVLMYAPEDTHQIKIDLPPTWKPQLMQKLELKINEESKTKDTQMIEYPDYYVVENVPPKIFAPNASAIEQGNQNSSFNSGSNFNLNVNDDKEIDKPKGKDKSKPKDTEKPKEKGKDKKNQHPFDEDIDDEDNDLKKRPKTLANDRNGKNSKTASKRFNDQNDSQSDRESNRRMMKGRKNEKKPSRKYNNDSDEDFNYQGKKPKYYEGENDDDFYNKIGTKYIDNNQSQLSQNQSVMNFENGVPVPQRRQMDESMSIRDTD